MGADLITTGYTCIVNQPKPSDDELEVCVKAHADLIIKNRADIDYSDQFGLDYYDTQELANEALIDNIIVGARTVRIIAHEFYRSDNSWAFTTAAGEQRQFIVVGGTSWGDSPTDDFDALCLFLEAIAFVPQLGELTGVLQGGLKVD
jgi:hypothetical protein